MESYMIWDAHDDSMRVNLLTALLTRLRSMTDQRPGPVIAINLDYLDEPETLLNALNYQCGQSSN